MRVQRGSWRRAVVTYNRYTTAQLVSGEDDSDVDIVLPRWSERGLKLRY